MAVVSRKMPVFGEKKRGIKEDWKGSLNKLFGYKDFRENQEAIIAHILAGKDTFVIMPTGAGKSLCYQFPASIQRGTTLVISPLIALMKDQVDKLCKLNIRASFLNSTLTRKQLQKIKQETQAGDIRLLYISPEWFTKEDNIDFMRSFTIPFIAVDEAHSISEWGHDFRPEYRQIRPIIDNIGVPIPIIALTATATPKVRKDIIKNLGLREVKVFTSSFNRPNIFYEVLRKEPNSLQVIRYVQTHKESQGIVYCLTRKKVEEITRLLQVNNIEAVPYHAGMDSKDRMRNQEVFLSKKARIIVATVAFGMGIDKSDIHFVLHYEVPKSLENYYQETGRAGRDGKRALCTLLFDKNDWQMVEKFNQSKSQTDKHDSRYLLEELRTYIESPLCRRKQLLGYFGESHQSNCGMCDNCHMAHPSMESQDALWELLTVIFRIPRQKKDQLLSLLANQEQRKEVCCLNGTHCSTSWEGISAWRALLQQAIEAGYLHRYLQEEEVWSVSEKGKEFLAKKKAIHFFLPRNYDTPSSAVPKASQTSAYDAIDHRLFHILSHTQKRVAKAHGIPSYAIFPSISLKELATYYPTEKKSLVRITGVGSVKAEKFGEPFLAAIRAYVKAHNIDPPSSVLVKQSISSSSLKLRIISLLDKKIDLDYISKELNISLLEVMDKMEQMCRSGIKLRIGYCIDSLLEQRQQEEIWSYFMQARTDSVDKAMGVLGDYTEEEIRLMRIKFLSEVSS